MQLALFDQPAAEAPDLLPLTESRRLHLERGAWVDYLPGWLPGHAALFDELDRGLRFRRRTRQMYDRVVEVPRAMHHGDIDHPRVRQMQAALERYLGEPLPHLSAALYESGRDSVAWHGDRIPRDDDRALVATVSLGAPRRFLLRPARDTADPRGTRAFALGWGDLIVMGGTCQRTYEHAVPKVSAPQGPRMVVMFRSHYDEG